MVLLFLMVVFDTFTLYKLFETIINYVRYIIEINGPKAYIVFFITQGNLSIYFSLQKIGLLRIKYLVK